MILGDSHVERDGHFGGFLSLRYGSTLHVEQDGLGLYESLISSFQPPLLFRKPLTTFLSSISSTGRLISTS
jgi:hypothetical protein